MASLYLECHPRLNIRNPLPPDKVFLAILTSEDGTEVLHVAGRNLKRVESECDSFIKEAFETFGDPDDANAYSDYKMSFCAKLDIINFVK